jgi:hypothetical protein
MATVPIKAEYGPTLGRLLTPRWRGARPRTRAAAVVSASVLLALLLAATLALLNGTFSHAGSVPFSFNYRDLHRVAPDRGGYVKVQRRSPAGRLEDSFAVDPLRLRSYSGDPTAQLALYATSYLHGLSRRYPHFVLRGEGTPRGEGTTAIASLPTYDLFYTAVVEGRRMYGRDVLLLPERSGAREGVVIVMLSSAKANSRITSPLEVASVGVLARPLKTFSLG